ncbi:hypothetical protein [Methanobrevibacter sp.]|uniref:hypothetical protein n=1 Tax=Methanobrevibacter sp. TaxID=66852 RepID=UPI0038676411
MPSDDEKTFQDKVNEIKDTDEIKREETILKANEKGTTAKIRFQEKRLERKKSRNEKKLQSHIKSAEDSVDKAFKDADLEIKQLSEEIAIEIKNEEGPEDFILYKASSILKEIYLRAQLKIIMAKNDLITNLQDDLEDNLEVAEFEEDIAGLKEKTDHLIGTLEGKIATEKEEMKEKYGSE